MYKRQEYYPVVNSCVDNMIRQGRAEVQYPWQHPVFGRIYIRCGGVAERISEKVLRLRGYHQNVTDTIVKMCIRDSCFLYLESAEIFCQLYMS